MVFVVNRVGADETTIIKWWRTSRDKTFVRRSLRCLTLHPAAARIAGTLPQTPAEVARHQLRLRRAHGWFELWSRTRATVSMSGDKLVKEGSSEALTGNCTRHCSTLVPSYRGEPLTEQASPRVTGSWRCKCFLLSLNSKVTTCVFFYVKRCNI